MATFSPYVIAAFDSLGPAVSPQALPDKNSCCRTGKEPSDLSNFGWLGKDILGLGVHIEKELGVLG